MITVCNICGANDTYQSNGDLDYCNECHSVEQGFEIFEQWDYDDNLYIDNDGNLYNDILDLVGFDLDYMPKKQGIV